MRVFLTILLAGLSLYVQAQADSLQRLIEKEKINSRKLDLLLQIADVTKNSDPLRSFYAAQNASLLAGNEKALEKKVKAEYYMALYYNKSDKVDSVLFYTRRNIAALQSSGDKSLLLVDFNNLEGGYYMHLNRQREALQRFYSSLRIAEETGDAMSGIKSYGNIGWAFMELNRFDTAIVYFKKCIHLMQSNNLDIFAAIYNNTASCFGDLKKYDSAKLYVLRGIEVAGKNNDLVAKANGLNILGTVYEFQKQYTEAVRVLLEAGSIREKIGDPFFIVSDMATLAGLYSKTGEHRKGIDISLKALDLARKNNISTKLPMIYESLAANYEADGNYKEAAAVYKKINELKDSIYSDASPQALAEMQTKYETEKKERKIGEQQSRIARQNLLITGTGILILLLLILAITQYRRFKWKQEAKLKAEILKQQEMSTRAVLEAEEAERQRIAKDLHDGIGQMMSVARMNLSAFEQVNQFRDVEDRQAFDRIIGLVDESCKEVRAVSHNMMPNALIKNSLAAAIREFINRLDPNKLKVHLYTEGLDERLDSNLETVLYRVIQECVNNVIKHASADTLDISVVKEAREISATIEDNGKGFDADRPGNPDGMGLKNIRTRVEYLKGTVEFDSTPGKGTLIAIHVPI